MTAARPSGAGTTAVTGAVMFSDIVGFTELAELHGDDAALAVLDAQDGAVRSCLTAAPTGRVVKELGDGLLLWFDDPREAVCTALDVQDALRERSVAHGGDLLPVWARIGIHWGTPRRRGDDVIGRDVNLASRITGLAAPGEVLCTEAAATAATAVGPLGVSFVPLGAMFVKGVPDPVPLLRAQRDQRPVSPD